MCLIAIAWRVHPRYPLVMIANRDEFHARPSAAAAAHPQYPELFGGRDLDKGGSWLLASAHGRLAAVTNVRLPIPPDPGAASRGELVLDFVRSALSAPAFARDLMLRAERYAHFNLVTWDGENLHYVGTHPQAEAAAIAPGLHVLSNASLNSPWPKALRLRQRLIDWLAQSASEPSALEPLFAALADSRPAADAELPDTGVGLARERFLSAPFIVGADYGTRCSTVVLANAQALRIVERRFGPMGQPQGETSADLLRSVGRPAPDPVPSG